MADQEPKPKKKKRAAVRTAAPTGRGRKPATPFPPVTFASVLPFADAIQQHGAGQPIRRITLFDKLGRSPESSAGRLTIVNSGRYGLTKGGYQAESLELTELGKVATSPEADATEKLTARFKLAIDGIPAFKFLFERNKDHRLPSPEVLRDSLSEAKIDEKHRKECVEIFLENLKVLGLLRTIAGAERVVKLEHALEDIPSGSRTSAGSADAPRLGDAPPPKAQAKSDWKKTCFVIAPIGEEDSEERRHSNMVLEALITRALEGEKWNVVRADQITKPGMISGQVVEYLVNAGLVIADLSFHNPNVFYELAIRHVVGRPTVHLIRTGDGIPFDLKDFRTISIDTSDKYDLVAKLDIYRAEIANYVREAVSELAEVSNPVSVFAKDIVQAVAGARKESA